jgi:phage shock protein C
MTRYGRRLHRSRTQKIWTGVCGGIAEHSSLSPGLIRALAIVLFFISGTTILWVYFALIFILPVDTEDQADDPFIEQVRYSHQGRMQGLEELEGQYKNISQRLIRIEDIVSSKTFALEKEIDQLSSS